MVKKFFQSAPKDALCFGIIETDFRFDFSLTEMKRGIFEGTAVPSAVPPSHPARQKGGEEMGLLPSL